MYDKRPVGERLNTMQLSVQPRAFDDGAAVPPLEPAVNGVGGPEDEAEAAVAATTTATDAAPCCCKQRVAELKEEFAAQTDRERKAAISDADTHSSTTCASNCSNSGSSTSSWLELGDEVLRPDFSGRWLFHRYEGDFEAMLVEGGVPWATRKLAKAANFGVGIMAQVIRHEDDGLSVDYLAGPTSIKQRFRIGAGEQETVDETGARIILTPTWEGQSLLVESSHPKTKKNVLPSSRYLLGDEMVIETRLQNGSLVMRYYRR